MQIGVHEQISKMNAIDSTRAVKRPLNKLLGTKYEILTHSPERRRRSKWKQRRRWSQFYTRPYLQERSRCVKAKMRSVSKGKDDKKNMARTWWSRTKPPNRVKGRWRTLKLIGLEVGPCICGTTFTIHLLY